MAITRIFQKGNKLILALVALTTLSAEGMSQTVISPVGEVALSAQQAHYLREQLSDGTVSAYELVEVQSAGIKGPRIVLDVMGKGYSLNEMYTNMRTERDYSWFGRSDDGYGSGVLVVNNGMVSGHLTLDFVRYSLMPLGEGLHVLMTIDFSAFPKDESEVQYREKLKTAGPPVLDHIDYDGDPMEAMPKALNNCSIRYLIAFTTEVRDALADVHGFIQLCIDSHNLINANSQGDHNVELAISVRVSYTSVGGDFETDLERFKSTNDGFMDEIHGLRNQYDADVCQLLVNNGTGCGLAYGIGSSYSTAFAVTKRSCAVDNNTFTHETGHLYGALHDPFVDGTLLPFPYGHGYVKISGAASTRWRTVMSYNDHCESLGSGCPRIPYWSNPDVSYDGNAAGTTFVHNNALVVRNQESVLAAYESQILNKNVTNTTVFADEWGNIEGTTTVTAPGGTSTSVDYRSGSKGNYRAGSHITLKEGFWARDGADFVAYVGSCSNPQFFLSPADENGMGGDQAFGIDAANSAQSLHSDAMKEDLSVQIFPNPFADNVFIEVESPAGSSLKIDVYNMIGSLVLQAYEGPGSETGILRVEALAGALPSGVYIVKVQVNGKQSVHRVVKSR